MSLAERQQRAYDAREISVLEAVRSGVDPFTAAINAIRGVRIPYNRDTSGGIFTSLLTGVGDAVASIWGANTSSLSAVVKPEGNYNIAGGRSYSGGVPIGAQIAAGLRGGNTPVYDPLFVGSADAAPRLATGSSSPVGRVGGGGVPAFEDFWNVDTGKPVASATGGGSLWIWLGVGALVIFFVLRAR